MRFKFFFNHGELILGNFGKILHSETSQSFEIQNFLQPWWKYSQYSLKKPDEDEKLWWVSALVTWIFDPSETGSCSKLIFRYFAVENQGNKDFSRWIKGFPLKCIPLYLLLFHKQGWRKLLQLFLIIYIKWTENFDNLEIRLETVVGYAGAESLWVWRYWRSPAQSNYSLNISVEHVLF